MFNKKAKRIIAIIGLVAMCLSTMASCQVGGTYAEKAGDQSVIDVAAKKPEFVPYDGEIPVEIIDTTDPAYKPENNGGSSDDGSDDNNGGNEDVGANDDNNGGNENVGDENEGGNENSGGNEDEGWDDEDEEEVKYDERNKLKIVAYNLRIANDSGTYGGAKDIADRMPRFKEKVMDVYQPDVVGMSECGPTHINYLQSDYSSTPYGSYQVYFQYRAVSSKETTPVMWNTDKLEALETGHFWMSDTPDTESKADNWGTEDLYRITNWAKLKVKATGKTFIFFSTHFDFDDITHVNSVNLIYKRAKEMGAFSKYAFFFVGDCNMGPWGKGYNAVYDTDDIADINWELNNDNGSGTGNGYHLDGTGEGEGGGSNPIDYIFYSPAKIHPLHYEVIDVMGSDGDWISDHRGLYAEAALL